MKFLLELFVMITGIGAASGLHYQGDSLFIVSDNSNYLYQYRIPAEQLSKHLLIDMDGQNEQVKKKQKLDLEAITYYNGEYYLLPSGSKPNRTKSFYLSSTDLDDIGLEDLDSSYRLLRKHLDISQEDFNIEGAIFDQDTILLFNRGNGPLEKNGIIKFPFGQNDQATFTPVPLPKINEKTTGFTDAILVDGKIYFLAAAEEGKSNYHDGVIGGSQVGVLDRSSFMLERAETISLKNKFEGITYYGASGRSMTFLLCEDPDDDGNVSTIYKLTLKR